MSELQLQLTEMAHGGSAIGRDESGRVIFVPYGIPGETVVVAIERDRGKFAHGRIVNILATAPERVEPPCPHFGVCGGCHFQHIDYEAQLRFKRDVVVDQLVRIGGVRGAAVRPVIPSPLSYDYRIDAPLSRAPDGRLGYWSPALRQVVPIDTCLIIRPELRQLLEDIDIDLPGLRKLTLRIGDDEAMLAAMEVQGVEPPALEADFPVSAAIVLPDNTAANLVGDNFVIQSVRGRDFRVSAGVFFHPNLGPAAALVETVLNYARPSAAYVLEGYSGTGMLTAFLAEQAAGVIGIEPNPDAVDDAAVNLADFDNIYFYQGKLEEILPELEIEPDVIVVDPTDGGLEKADWEALRRFAPERFVYSSASVAALARDAKKLTKAGYRLAEVQPIDMFPQNFEVQTVSLWRR